jgi:hypothetical protein
LPLTESLEVRSAVLRGSMEYSLVTQPLPFPFKNPGTSSETEAVQRTFVFPMQTRTEPSAYRVKDLKNCMERIFDGMVFLKIYL